MRAVGTRGAPMTIPCPEHETDHTHALYDPKQLLAIDEAVKIEEPTAAMARSEQDGLAVIAGNAFVPTFLGVWLSDFASCEN